MKVLYASAAAAAAVTSGPYHGQQGPVVFYVFAKISMPRYSLTRPAAPKAPRLLRAGEVVHRAQHGVLVLLGIDVPAEVETEALPEARRGLHAVREGHAAVVACR